MINNTSKTNKDYYLLIFQSELKNLIANKEINNEIFYSLIENMDETKLKNNEDMDLYLCENLFSTLLPGLESLSKTAEKLIYYSDKEDEREVKRFNPCNFLAEFLMRNNPRYGKNQETHDKFLRFTRKERKTRMIKGHEQDMFGKLSVIYKQQKAHLNKMNILSFVEKVDGILNLQNTLVHWEWLEYFRVYKDNQEISLANFEIAFHKAVLDLHDITEEMVKKLIA